jgi:Plasmid pRiA4b ORF-3-like protein
MTSATAGSTSSSSRRALRPRPDTSNPACTAGEGACPPEDAGGYPGYQQLKEILADPSNEEYEEMRAWADSQVHGEFDPASFDLAQASARVSIA